MTIDPDAIRKRIAELRADDQLSRAQSFLAGGDSPPLYATTTVMLAHSMVALVSTADMLEELLTERDLLRAEVGHWRAARNNAIEAGEVLKNQRDMLRADLEAVQLTEDERQQLEHHIRSHEATCATSCSLLRRLIARRT